MADLHSALPYFPQHNQLHLLKLRFCPYSDGHTHLFFCLALVEMLIPKPLPLENGWGAWTAGQWRGLSILPSYLFEHLGVKRIIVGTGLLFWMESEEKLLALLVKLLYFQLLTRSPRAQRGILLNTEINKNCCLIGQTWIISTTPRCIHLGCAYLHDMWTNCLTLAQNIALFTQRKLHNRNLLTHHTTIF